MRTLPVSGWLSALHLPSLHLCHSVAALGGTRSDILARNDIFFSSKTNGDEF